MSISFGLAAVATLVTLVLAGMLVHRCVRMPRLDIVAALCAILGLAVALAAQALGYHRGFGPTTFRAVHLGGQLLAPMALAWALTEMTGKSLGARFAARLALGGLTMVAAVVLASDPLGTAAFSKAWPTASVHYQFIPNAILELVAIVATVTAVVAVVIAGLRARRYPGWRELFPGVAAAAAATLFTDGLRVSLPANSGYVVICLIAAGFAWFAATRSSRVRLDVLRFGGPVWDEDTGEFVRYNEDTGEFAPYRDEAGYPMDRAGYGREGSDTGYPGWFRDDTGGYSRDDTGGYSRDDTGGDGAFTGWFRDDTGGFSRDGSDASYPYGGADSGFGHPAGNNGANGRGAGFETGDMLPAVDGYPALPDDAAAAGDETSRLYGQIAIYTLLDSRAEDFDRLVQHVIAEVKAREPDTLIYVMHGVPSAPMQRILYEVYRDEAAFDGHLRQPHIQRFEEERKPYVLATNVIELGVRQAKFPVPPPPPPRGEEVRPWGNSAR